MPSVLIELGYVSSRDDIKQLTSDGWRAQVSEKIVGAIDQFFTTRLAGSGTKPGSD